MRNDKKDLKNKKKSQFTQDDITKQYDEGKDSYPERDTFRNVIDSFIIGESEEDENDSDSE
ncbi:hypothetical protein [Sporosalibacterium faouarense]|uniref:hypothetical protein n=1 Tax=Sporosalibacterium faouarense TaxID=516123 RepID=UPI00141D1337|nr:hypothetical protein [Sporosalibacterium faouarense]MTI49296.1 hypothetical protein [Bacillota bacterium]